MIERFKSLLDQLRLTPSEFADRIGVQRSSISHLVSGRNKPSIDFLEKILIAFPDTDIKWLITGITGTNDRKEAGSFSVDNGMILEETTGLDESPEIKTPVPLIGQPVDHIIIVYKDNTFRLLSPKRS